ncbi:SUMF1/EgtB/PvdO family nonheme iron enzyme [Reichenbachiella sp.]|uniref:SUMF1/EgtB/PvdO family nonheme iron enzyme n=1 Tax=Reichenbachiella sp. TaxID=2184521 RepID=UPI0032979C92
MEKFDVFISYSTIDRLHAERLTKVLEQGGYRTFFSEGYARDGDWRKRIDLVIKQASAFIPIVSNNSIASDEVTQEYAVAKDRQKRIMPYKIEDCPLTYQGGAVDQVIEQFKNPDGADGEALAFVQEVFADRKKEEIRFLKAISKGARQYLAGSFIPLEYQHVWGGLSRASDIVPARKKIESAIGKVDRPDIDTYSKSLLETFDQKALGDEIRVIVTGGAGSGKSTTLRKLEEEISEASLSQLENQETRSTCLLPVFIPLEGYDGKDSVESFITTNVDTPTPYVMTHFDELVAEGRLFLLMDGLSEGGSKTDLRSRSTALAKFLEDNPQLSTCVTCLSAEYTAEKDLDLELFKINDLNPDRIRRIIHQVASCEREAERIFWSLVDEERAEEFLAEFIEKGGDEATFWKYSGSENPIAEYYHWNMWVEKRDDPFSLLTLAKNTFFLVIIIEIYKSKRRPTSNRFQLFNLFFEVLTSIAEEDTAGKFDASLHSDGLLSFLSKLAYLMISSSQFELAEDEIFEKFGEEVKDHLDIAVRQKLLTVESSVKFSHQLFRAFFASFVLDDLVRTGGSIPGFPERDGWWHKTSWDEAFVFLVGKNADRPDRVLSWMSSINPELASRCITESGCKTSKLLLDDLSANWLDRLKDEMEKSEGRAAVGRALGRTMRDSRAGVCRIDNKQLPIFEWCEIAEKSFNFGNSQPEEMVRVPKFKMSKYLVTNKQFQSFIDDEGYSEAHKDCWTEAGWTHIVVNGRQSPVDYTEVFRLSNHPRIGTIWYEAYAYTKWLTKKMRARGLMDGSQEICLPTEHEWESAARGPDGTWTYPWGDDFDYAKCNVLDIGSTSAVGIFSEGASVEGVHDLVGNCWSWCMTKRLPGSPPVYDDAAEGGDDFSRSYRGGSWAFDTNSKQSATELSAFERYWVHPLDDQPDALGFFIVVRDC